VEKSIPVLAEVASSVGYFLHQVVPDEIARLGKPAVPALARALHDENAYTRCWAARVLGKIGPQAKEVVPVLIGMLEDKEHGQFGAGAAAARALGNMGPDAKRAVPELVKLLENASMRAAAAEALAKLDPAENEKHIPIFVKALRSAIAWQRRDAIHALGRMGPAAKEAVPALEELLYDLDKSVRSAAAEAIEEIRAATQQDSSAPDESFSECPKTLHRRLLEGDELKTIPELMRKGDLDAAMRMADHLFLQCHGANERAIRLYKRILERDPKNFKAAFFVGQSYAAQGRHEKALEQFRAAKRLTKPGSEEEAWVTEVIRREESVSQPPTAQGR